MLLFSHSDISSIDHTPSDNSVCIIFIFIQVFFIHEHQRKIDVNL